MPDQDTVYEITFRRGGPPVYGYMRDLGNGLVEIRPDAPWDPNLRPRAHRQEDIADAVPELVGTRERRIERGWRQAGFVQVQTADGLKWLPKHVVELAKRSRTLAGLTPEPSWEEPIAAEELAASDASTQAPARAPTRTGQTTPPDSRKGNLMVWGGQALLVVVGLALAASVVKWLA